MPFYRFYALDEAGHIARAENVECRDDEAAADAARSAASMGGMEVWQGARLVARISTSAGITPASP